MRGKMKKFFAFLGILVFGCSFFIGSSSIKAAPALDQSCEAVPATGQQIHLDTIYADQHFKPTVNRLTSVAVQLWTNSAEGNGWFYVKIYTTTYTQLLNQLVQKQAGEGAHWYTVNIGSEITLTPDTFYILKVVPYEVDPNLGWFYKESCEPRGYAIYNNVQQTYDFEYRTYGYTYEPATPAPNANTNTNTGAGDTNTNSGATTGNSKVTQGSGPSSNISSAIAKPTNLLASHSIKDKVIALS